MNNTISDFSFSLMIWQTFILIYIGLWVYCLIDLLRNEFKNSTGTIWLLIVLLIPFLGVILYLSIGKKDKITSHTKKA